MSDAAPSTGGTTGGAAPADAHAWVAAYAAAWRGGDAAAAGALFAADAAYTFDPFGPGLRGREQVVAHWTQALAAQSELRLEVEEPVVDGDRAATAWRARFVRDGEQVELAAALLLRFDADGRCADLREFWLQSS
ncbi:nuclear transport factor 2 family protein [Conexibacter sp. JD483]|uniref:nuclear transport factor 2 family protein n=1 Tax=unclassified Conexibacter TaxID=2627773 RepID=UPI002724903B|nr:MULTISPECIES: nuclear transport factor 2 family protein [unclassified Conexibacter]MDO8185568.1 nuclear transport factor 2 family protein [Conexibacter sp. CPCC 205706]MDO8197245.1 nuclear transport factor 2 family protein [Conexibacter sp. CPCC 205762]MDR9371526.1 nuclear transport factor 2 family protein [Conexibacter sp. JD483]